MKNLLNYIAAVSLCLYGCQSTYWDNDPDSDMDTSVACISVSSSTYAATRSTDSNLITTFNAGDKIGLFAKQGEGAATKFIENACLMATLNADGSLSWIPTDTSLKEMRLSANATYYAYYPYKDNEVINMKALVEDHWNQPDAEGFFSEAASVWENVLLATNQQTHEQYTQGDLMVAKGTVSTDPTTHITTLKLHMKHMMGLTILDLSKTKALEHSIAFNGFAPYRIDPVKHIYHYLIPSDKQVSLSGRYTDGQNRVQSWSFSTRTQSGTYNRYTIKDEGDIEYDPNRPYYRNVKVGDYFLNTGWITNRLDTLPPGVYPIAVVFHTFSSTDGIKEDPALNSEHPQCEHGLAVALTEYESEWQSELPTEYSAGEWIDTYATQYTSIRKWKPNSAPVSQLYGYNNTKAIEAYNQADENQATPVMPIEQLVQFRKSTSVPLQYCSDWFLPSRGEITLMHHNGVLQVVNERLETIRQQYPDRKVSTIGPSSKDSPYSTNYERNDNKTVLLCVHSNKVSGPIAGIIQVDKTYKQVRYRPVLAF